MYNIYQVRKYPAVYIQDVVDLIVCGGGGVVRRKTIPPKTPDSRWVVTFACDITFAWVYSTE